MQLLYHVTILIIFSCLTWAQSEGPRLSVYHKRGNDFIKRGEITGLPDAPIYEPTTENIADPTEDLESLYQVKFKDESTGVIMLSSLKYASSLWQDLIRIHLSDKSQIYHVDYFANGDVCDTHQRRDVKAFQTQVEVIRPGSAPAPLLGAPTKKGPAPTHRGSSTDPSPEGEVIEEKSFFQKYWYILLAGALILLTNSAAPPPEGASSNNRR